MRFLTYLQAAGQLLLASSVSGAPVADNSSLSYFTTADGATYAYDYRPAQGAKATFLFLHGYPSTHEDWDPQVAALTAAGFGTLAPDMLGFGLSDRPTDTGEYRQRRLVGHLDELLDHAGLDRVVGVGHDWGVVVLSRMAAYHRDRFEKLIFVNVGHQAPGGFVDIDAINAQSQVTLGYMPLGYWYFFTRYDAGTVIKNHLESFWHLVFPVNHTVWREHLAPVGAARAWLAADTQTEDAPFLDGAYKAHWLASMRRPNATEAGLNCYRSQLSGLNVAEEQALDRAAWELRVPVLAVGGARDPIARADDMVALTEPWAKAGFEYRILDGGHWIMRERADEVSGLMLEFAERA